MPAKKRDNKETLPTNNLFAIIIVLFIVASAFSSYLTYEKSSRVVEELTGGVVTQQGQARLCVNKQPSINQSCNTTAEVGVGYYCDVDGSDPDNDTLTFFDNTSLFSIDANTGEIIFTPAAGDAGTHSVLITTTDGRGCDNSNASEAFTLTITGVPVIPPGPGGGGGGGGGGGAVAECSPQWECTPWTSCRPEGTRTRNCYTLNNCPKDKPAETQNCIYVLPPSPRVPKYQEFEFCDFDVETECLRNVGLREDWLLTYKGKVGAMNFLSVAESGLSVSIDDSMQFLVGFKRIKPVDLDGDGVDDVDFIFHSTDGTRADVTGRLIRQVEVVLERPVYIEMLPWWLMAIIVFVYNNACLILLMVMILASVMIYAGIMRTVEEHEKKKKREKQ